MNATVNYSIIYEILLKLREDFHSYGRIDDSNAKLDEIIKLICLNYSLAKRGIKFDLELVKNKSVELYGDNKRIAKALNDVFIEEAKRPMFYNLDNTNIFGSNISLNLQATENEFAYKLINEIEKINFLRLIEDGEYSDFDIVNECFGHFVRENFRNNKEDAQYMTPSEITLSILNIIFNIMENDGYINEKNIENFTIMDPSCGVGTLLIESSKYFTDYVKNRLPLEKYNEKVIKTLKYKGVIGQDKVDRMVRLAKINMLLLDGNISNIIRGNSIIGKSEIDKYKNKINMIFTNPPFGAEYNREELILEDYPILKKINGQQLGISSELLMLDKCINLLENGGYLVIILPDSVFSAKGINELYRNELLSNHEVRGIIELPDVTFAQAGTRVKTSVMFLKKGLHDNKKIFMANCEDIGYKVKERVGVPIKISCGINQMPIIAKQVSVNKIKEGIILEEPSITFINKEELISNILKPSFYSANIYKYIQSMNKLKHEGFEAKKLGELVDIVTKEREFLNVDSTIKHISVLHINSDATINFEEVEKYKPISKGRICKEGDIIFSKINPRISRIAVIPKSKYQLVCSSEFEIMRPKDEIETYTLCFLLKSKDVKIQIENLTSGTSSSHSRIKREQLENIILPIPFKLETKERFKKINDRLKSNIENKYKVDKHIRMQVNNLEKLLK